jgi:CubicO group peptidase (beta-lactamase class C family)
MSARLTLATLAFLLLAATGTTLARAGSEARSADTASRFDAFLRQSARKLDFNGSVLIAIDGRVVLRKGYGQADAADRRRNTPRTRFRISDLTTDFTTVGLLQLHERGRVRLDRSICAYVPRCPGQWKPLTVRLLLTGPTGLPVVLPRSGSRSLVAWIDWLKRKPLRFTPGRSGRDRGYAADLLAAYVLTRVSGLTWIEYLERHIFRPLRLTSTGLDRPQAARATPYVRTRTRRLRPPAAFRRLSVPDVVFGLMSTVDDMYRFDRALMSGSIVSTALLDELAATPDVTGHRVWQPTYLHLGHGPHGTADGWYTAYTRYADEKLLILAFSNLGLSPLSDVVGRLYLIAKGWPPARVQVDPELLSRYVGRYTRRDSARRRNVTVVIAPGRNGTLRFGWDLSPRRLDHARRYALIPFASDAFYATGDLYGIAVRFEVGAEPGGDAVHVEFPQGGRSQRFRRVP